MRKDSRIVVRGMLFGAVAGVAGLLATVSGATADDAGIQQFLQEQFGFGGPSREEAPPASAMPMDEEDRPLVVRRHRRHTSELRAKPVVVGPTPKVSIYEDPTLRKGDAVMTAQGIRIFKGGRSLPYTDADFVALSKSDGLSRVTEQALLAINQLPRQ